MTIRIAIVLTTLLGLIGGCGGGGGGSAGGAAPLPTEEPPPNEEPLLPPEAPLSVEPSLAGLWEGTNPDGRKVTALVGDDGIYGGVQLLYSAADNEAVVAGLITGRFWQKEDLPINGPGAVDFNFEGGGVMPARVVATAADAGESLGIRVYAGPQFADLRDEVTLSRHPLPRPASVVGVYEGELSGVGGGERIRFAIDEAGSIETSGGTTCEVAGEIFPHSFLYHFGVQLTFSGSSCALSVPRELWGWGIYDPENNRLQVGVNDYTPGSSNSPEYGAAFSGRREVAADFDSDGLSDSEDPDNDNDGIADTGDSCPWNANRNCPHTMLAGDTQWLQPKDFSGLSWADIDAVCPADAGGACDGVLRGREMRGWTWASAADVRTLFTTYGFEHAPPELAEPQNWPQQILPNTDNEAPYAWEQAGWRPTSVLCPWYCFFQVVGYTRDWPNDPEALDALSVPLLIIYPEGYFDTNVYSIGVIGEIAPAYAHAYDVKGGWFYRPREQ